MNKPLIKKLEVTQEDNLMTAFAKGGIDGYLKYSAVAIPVLSVLMLIGKRKQRIENVGE